MNRKYLLISTLSGLLLITVSMSLSAVLLNADLLTPQKAYPPFLLLLAAVLLSLSIGLKRSLDRTVYSYKNIGLTAGILFTLCFLCFLIPQFIRALRTEALITPQLLFSFLLDFPERFSVFALPVIFLISLLIFISNLSLIRHEGFRIYNLLGMVVGGGYIGATILLELFLRLLRNRLLIPRGLTDTLIFRLFYTFLPSFLLILLCYFDCIFVSCFILGYIAVKKKPVYDKDVVIILGCSIDDRGGLRPLLRGRVNRAIRFAWDQEIQTGRPVKYIPSGGQGPNEIISEGSAMELYLLSHGAESDEVIKEGASSSTRENFLYSKKIIDENFPDAKVAFATTNYHILRSGILARKAGIEAEGISAETKWYFWPNGFLREVIAIIVMYKKAHISFGIVTAILCFLLAIIAEIWHFV